MKLSLQDQYAPTSICFGCGPTNTQGLRIKSFVEGEQVVAKFTPADYHQAFPNVLNGGIIGALLDCHCNWTAAYSLMKKNNETTPPCTVTAEYSIKLLKPTPTHQTLTLEAHAVEVKEKKAVIQGLLKSMDGEICATCEGTFVAVKPGHPAFHRW